MIEDDKGMLECQAYLQVNRWACALRTPPEQYRHCGYAQYAQGKSNAHLDISPAWLNLGETDEQRQQAFAEIVAAKMEAKEEQRTMHMVAAFDGKLAYYGKPSYMREQNAALDRALKTKKTVQAGIRAAREALEIEGMRQALADDAALSGSGCEKR